MVKVFFANTAEGKLVATESYQNIFTKEGKLILVYLNDNRLFHNVKHNCFIVSLGSCIVKDVFLNYILNEFSLCIDGLSKSELKNLREIFQKFLNKKFPDLVNEFAGNKHKLYLVTINEKNQFLVSSICGEEHQFVVEDKNCVVLDKDLCNMFKGVENFADVQQVVYQHAAKFKEATALNYVELDKNNQVLRSAGDYTNHVFRFYDDFYEAFKKLNRGWLEYGAADCQNLIYELKKLNSELKKDLGKADYPYRTSRFIPFSEFIKKFKNRDDKHITYFLDLFNFVDSLNENDPLLAKKLQKILQAGTTVLITTKQGNGMDATKDEHGIFSGPNNLIELYPDITKIQKFFEVFKHEVEHAFVHTRNLNNECEELATKSDVMQKGLTFFCSVPFFIGRQRLEDQWIQNLNKGLARVNLLMEVLANGKVKLSSDEAILVSNYNKAYTLSQYSVNDRVAPLKIILAIVEQFSKNENNVETYHEVHAHLIDSLPTVVLGVIFKELVQHDKDATRESFGEDWPYFEAESQAAFYLVKKVEPLSIAYGDKIGPAVKSVTEQNYSKALRNCANSNEPAAFKLLTILLDYQGLLPMDINEKAGTEQNTALHYAASKKNKNGYQLLLANGADPEIKNAKNETASQIWSR